MLTLALSDTHDFDSYQFFLAMHCDWQQVLKTSFMMLFTDASNMLSEDKKPSIDPG